MLGKPRDYRVSLLFLAALFVASCGGGGSSSGGSSGGPVNTADIVATQDWVGSYEVTDGPTGAEGSGTLEIEFTGLLGSSTVEGDVEMTGDGCMIFATDSDGPMTGTIDPANGNTKLTAQMDGGVTVIFTGTATANEIRGTLQASGGPCSDNTQDAEGSWFVNPE